MHLIQQKSHAGPVHSSGLSRVLEITGFPVAQKKGMVGVYIVFCGL